MLVFVSSIGRSGTRFLSELFNHVTSIPSHHIPNPQCAGQPFYDYNNFKENKELKLKKKKVKNSIKNNYYFESSQLFLRCFVDEMINLKKELNVPLGVIHVTRNPLECAKSYTNRKSIPGIKKYRWRPSIDFKRNYYKINKKGLNLFQLNLWDWVENEVRFNHYKNNFDFVYDLKFEDYSNEKELKKMFKYFNIDFNKNKLKEEIENNMLPRGANPKPSCVTEKNTKDAIELFKKFKNKKNNLIFTQECYKDYPILKNIIK